MRADLDANQRFYGKRLDGPQLVLNSAGVEAPTPVPSGFRPSAGTSRVDAGAFGSRYFFTRSARRSATVPSTLILAKFLSLPSTRVQGAIFVLVRATISLTATV